MDVANLKFKLTVEDDWPPFAVESLPFRIARSGYELLKAPLFVKGLSVGDVIAPKLSEDESVETWQLVVRSARTTVWILRLDEPSEIDEALISLRSLGCNTVELPAYGCYAVDVPADVGIAAVDAILDTLHPELAAFAFPSMRHPDAAPMP